MEHSFTDSNFETDVLQRKGVVMVDFFASWCGPCQALGPTIAKLAEDFKGKALIGKYDTENNSVYAQKFGVSGIPCIKFWKDGEYLGELVGYRPYQDFEQTLEGFLKEKI